MDAQSNMLSTEVTKRALKDRCDHGGFMRMKSPMWILLGVSLTCTGLVRAEEQKIVGFKDTPILPGTRFHVHDPDRPQPPVIQTAGAVVISPPSDAIVLFDGKTLDAWKVKDGPAPWEVRDGVMVAKGKDIQTKEEFGAIQLHLEWRLPAERKVNGQGGGNSGVFLMGLYEVQVLQSNKNLTYPDGMAASLYGQQPPLANATSPQGEWNSYDITFVPPVYQDGKLQTPAKVTVIHNGVVVQNGESFHGVSGYRKLSRYPDTHPEKGPIRLQFHGDPIEFRNMWVRPLTSRPE
ncbi:MAG: hypothetical protein RL346_1191 [Verrucomicrobiota bacterium]|jgi:hypothetical protein